jgi:hypothetical protein
MWWIWWNKLNNSDSKKINPGVMLGFFCVT